MADIAMDGQTPLSDHFATLRRRRWRIAVVAFTIMAAASAAALLWPPTYRSSATILIEEPDVPNDLVRSTVSAFADERLQVIQQRVMTTQNLVNIIDKFSLYADQRQTQPASVLVEKMRQMISLELVSADATDPKSGRSGKATIAFTLSFDGAAPQTTQQVANELVTLYLSENQRTREEQASGTAGFLTAESRRLAEQIQQLEARLAQYKAENAGSLPEEFQINTQLLDRAQGQLLETMRQVQALRERQTFLQSQLGQIDPFARQGVVDEKLLDPEDKRRFLESQYAELSAKYGASHPDVLAIRRQIDALGVEGQGGAQRDALQIQLKSLESELSEASKKYGSQHPEVTRLQRAIESTKEIIDSTPAPNGSRKSFPDNPAYIQTQAQLSSVNAELDAATLQMEALRERAKALEERVFKSPEVERNYVALKREYDAAVAKYEEIRSKESEAELAKSLEAERMGEKLSVIEPPLLPTRPIKPNRSLVLALGLLLAIAGGTGSAVVLDSVGGRVYGRRQLATVLGDAPLAVVPLIRTRQDRRKAVILRGLVVAAVVICLAGGAAYLNTHVAPLDVLWAMLANRLAL